jgi:O-antigen/teichoic acid export membrane protein
MSFPIRNPFTNKQGYFMQRFRHYLQAPPLQNFARLFSASLLSQLITLLLSPVLSRLYTPDDFGLVALYLGIFSIVSVFATGKYEQAIMLPKKDEDAASLFHLVARIALFVSLMVLILVIPFRHYIAQVSGNSGIALWLLFLPLGLFLHGLQQAATFFANRKKRFGVMARATLTEHGTKNTVRVLAGALKTPFNGLIAGHLLSQLLTCVYLWKSVRPLIKNTKVRPSRSAMQQQAGIYKNYPKYLMMLSLTNNLSGALPILMFTRGFSPEVAGLYAFGFMFVFRPISLFAQSATQVLSQQTIERFHLGEDIFPSLKKMVSRLLLISILPFSVLAIWAPGLFALVFSEQYAVAGTYLQILSPWLFMVFLTSPLSFVPELFFRQKKAMIIDIIYLILRFTALAAGIALQNVLLALAFFSAVSTLVVSYNLFWYLRLAKHNKHPVSPSAPHEKQ